MKSTTETSMAERAGTRLFRFSAKEERMLALAKKLSMAFMETYGKGREPYMLNRKNYL